MIGARGSARTSPPRGRRRGRCWRLPRCWRCRRTRQTPVDADWGGIPAGLAAGTPFRLLFVTSEGIACTSTDIAIYNTFVQGRAGAHTALSAHSARFRAVASTAAVDARDNTGSSGSTVAIYWLGGAKAADSNGDFYDGTLDSYAGKTETGSTVGSSTRIWTGSRKRRNRG